MGFAAGLAGLRPGGIDSYCAPVSSPSKTGQAQSTILFFLCGGASHIDMWDLKPNAPAEFRGPFQATATSAPGLHISEHLPLLAQQGHHLAVVRSVGGTVSTNDHHAGYYYNLTGHVPDPSFLALRNNRTPMPDDWPYIGSVVAARRPVAGAIPNAVTLPHKPSRAPYTRPGQFAARLGVEHDPLYVDGVAEEQQIHFRVPALTLSGAMTSERMAARGELLRAVDDARRSDDAIGDRFTTWNRQQQRAFSLLTSSRAVEAFNVSNESESVRERYGNTVNGLSLLVARRLVQAEVPFITVFWKENQELASKCKSAGGWDTHGNNFNCLKNYLLPEFDRAFSALIGDLESHGLLPRTLLAVTSEMGRKPRIGDPRSGGESGSGRDHWTHCQSVVLAGGGIAGGQAYGSTDQHAEYPHDKPVTPAHIAHTIYHAMGIENLEGRDAQGRPYQLLQEGYPLVELFG